MEKELSYCKYCKLPKHQCQCITGEWNASICNDDGSPLKQVLPEAGWERDIQFIIKNKLEVIDPKDFHFQNIVKISIELRKEISEVIRPLLTAQKSQAIKEIEERKMPQDITDNFRDGYNHCLDEVLTLLKT